MQKSGFRFLGQGWRFWATVLLVFLVLQWIVMPRMSNFRTTAWIMFPCIMAILCLGLNLIFGFIFGINLAILFLVLRFNSLSFIIFGYFF